MSDSKKPISKTDKDKKNMDSKQTTKPAVVKKVATKKPNNTEEDKRTKAAIDKYKDTPLGELYEDLNGTQSYKDILQARRDELLKAKSIVDSGKRKIAIAKTSENTVDIEFRYQKDKTFKNHYIPKGNFNIITSDSEGTPAQQRDRVMGRSQERAISQEQQTFSSPGIIFKEHNAPARQVNITSTLEQRQDRVIGAEQQPQQMMQRPAPAQAPIQGNANAGQMMQRPVAQPTPAQVAPAPMMAPQAAPMMQPMPQQQVAPAVAPAQPAQPVAAQPAQPQKDLNAHKKHKLWPLYEQIELASKRTKTHRIILSFTVVISILLALLLSFFILWGFAINWQFEEFVKGDVGSAFSGLFSPLFK